jgi:hypothetical protein
MLKKHGDWMLLGSADEQKDAAEGTVEAWGRAKDNPVGGWYGQKKGYRGRLGDVRAAAARGARQGRARAQREEQPRPREVRKRWPTRTSQPSRCATP